MTRFLYHTLLFHGRGNVEANDPVPKEFGISLRILNPLAPYILGGSSLGVRGTLRHEDICDGSNLGSGNITSLTAQTLAPSSQLISSGNPAFGTFVSRNMYPVQAWTRITSVRHVSYGCIIQPPIGKPSNGSGRQRTRTSLTSLRIMERQIFVGVDYLDRW